MNVKNPSPSYRILADLKFRRGELDLQLAKALEEKRWSHVAGAAGIRDAVAAAARHVASLGKGLTDVEPLAKEFEGYAAECDERRAEAVSAERYAAVAMLDGQATGWLLAARLVREA